MCSSSPRISVVVPTTCEGHRRASIWRAIESLFSQGEEDLEVIVLVNGQRFDPDLLSALRADRRLRVIYESIGSLPRALMLGRKAARGAYFGFLDDDDEYLPGSLSLRRGYLEANPDVDVVVCNGWRVMGTDDIPFAHGFAQAAQNPLTAMTRANWLASCGGLYRAGRVGADYFDERFKYLEWTLLGFKLAASRRLGFVDTPTFRIHDTPDSLSKSIGYQTGFAEVMAEVLRLSLPIEVRRRVLRKLGNAHHSLSDFYRRSGDRDGAWRHHLISLRLPGGLGYLPYTLRLLWTRAGDT